MVCHRTNLCSLAKKATAPGIQERTAKNESDALKLLHILGHKKELCPLKVLPDGAATPLEEVTRLESEVGKG
ncbi:hypothetical protein GW17_00044428 [Ensete ventricosum]|nr:hypothetical protein GW17_00044428 [Ensete ventricosum]RZR95070.1 hypothetical protein BHM03_00023876 [Ensete ventricosum]